MSKRLINSILHIDRNDEDKFEMTCQIGIHCNINLNVDDELRELYFNKIEEEFGKENIFYIEKYPIMKNNGVINMETIFEIYADENNPINIIEISKKLRFINSSFINHYISSEESDIVYDKYKIVIKSNFNIDYLTRNTKNWYAYGILSFSDIKKTINNTNNRINDEWSHHIIVNSDKFDISDKENINKYFKKDYHMEFIYSDEIKNELKITKSVFRFFDTIVYKINSINKYKDNLLLDIKIKSFNYLIKRNENRELVNLFSHYYSKDKQPNLSIINLSSIINTENVLSISRNYLNENFFNKKDFSNKLQFIDSILKRSLFIDEKFINNLNNRKYSNKDKRDRYNNRIDLQTQTPFKNL